MHNHLKSYGYEKTIFTWNIIYRILKLIFTGNFYQLSIPDQNPVIINFTGFTGTGFAPDPAAGQLDSDDWLVTGLSDGSMNFGDTKTTGDFARGASVGKVTTGGMYAFDVGLGNVTLGVQPGGTDWTPGSFVLRIQNNTGDIISKLDISYSIIYNE